MERRKFIFGYVSAIPSAQTNAMCNWPYLGKGAADTVIFFLNVCTFGLLTYYQTVSALNSFLLALSLHPHVLKRAQMEIDTVVGNERLPTFSDRAALPYVNALALEVLRWHTVVPTGWFYWLFCLLGRGWLLRSRSSPCHAGRHPWWIFYPEGCLSHPKHLVESRNQFTLRSRLLTVALGTLRMIQESTKTLSYSTRRDSCL